MNVPEDNNRYLFQHAQMQKRALSFTFNETLTFTQRIISLDCHAHAPKKYVYIYIQEKIFHSDLID